MPIGYYQKFVLRKSCRSERSIKDNGTEMELVESK